jgi:crossover junction endodeoxyribonuclease RuvC
LGKNAQTFLKLGFLRGILYLLADQHGLQLSEFAPREIKMATTGFGGASKDQVASMMLRLFPRLSEYGIIERADVTDALAICLCAVWNHQQQVLRSTITKLS